MPETKIEASRINQTIEFDFSEIGLSDGTVSLPSLAFTSDQSTGLYRIGASDMALATGGIKALELDSSQRISIPVQLSIANAAFKTSLNVGGTGVSAPANTGTTPAAGTVARFQGNSNAVLDIGSNSSTYAWIQSTDQTGLSATYPIALNPNGGQILYSDGTLSAPSIAFNAQANTGIYRAAASDLGIVAGGVLVAEFASTKAIFSQPVLIPDGTVSAPGLNFGSDQTTGIYRGGAGNISLSSAGTSILSVNSSGLTMNSGKIFSNYFYGGAQATGVSANTGYVFDAKDNTTTGTYLRTRNTANSGDANLVVGMTATSATTSIGRFSHGGVDVLETDQSGTTVSFKLNVYNGTSQLPVLQGNTVQQALFADGTSGAPTISFANQTNTGIYRPALNVFEITVGGTNALGITTGTIQVESGHNITNQNGSVSSPAYSFANKLDTGMYYLGSTAGEVGFSTAGSIGYRMHPNVHSWYIGGVEKINISSGGNFIPVTDNTISLGQSGLRWTAVWAVNGSIQTSHSSTKSNIVPLDWESLEIPAGVMYDRDGRRWLGYLNDSIPDEGRPIDESGQVCSTANYEQAVIGVLCAVVKGLKDEVAALKAKLGA